MTQEELIHQARTLLKPSPVRPCHLPGWFRRALLREFGSDGSSGGNSIIYHAIDRVRDATRWRMNWLDHWGSTLYRGQRVFVSEPYGVCPEGIREIAALAARCGCNWHLDPNSWWFPSKTIRILIYQPT